MQQTTLHTMSKGELQSMLHEKQDELRKMRFKSSQGQFNDIRKIRNTKREIASILTIIGAQTNMDSAGTS